MTTGAVEARAAGTRYVPWLLRFRRTGRGGAELRLERADDEAGDPRASTATFEGLKVAARGVFFERGELTRELGLKSIPEVDAQLVLYAYRRWGREGIRRLRGIFAVFIWDGERECLLAARDHLGLEPLFYARARDEWLFAPSPSTLLAQPGVPRAPNAAVLVDAIYWQWPFPEETSLQGIRRVLPGHVVTVTDVSSTSNRYWKPFDELEERGWATSDELAEFDRLLERSVSQSLDLGSSGIFLSGGLDSVSIAAVAVDLAKRRGLAKPLALSLAFPEPWMSEEHVQRGVANALGLPQLMLGLEESVAPDGFVRRGLDLSADWPLPRTFIWAGAYLRLARQGAEEGVDVIMTGDGGDEWLTVDPKLAADFIQAGQFGSLYRFARSKIDSFSVPKLPAAHYLLWQSGLREVLRFHVVGVLGKRAPALLRARRRGVLARTELPWVAPDPELRAEVRARRLTEIERDVEPPKVGGRFRFYQSDLVMALDHHPEFSAQHEGHYEVGRRAGVEFMHPYWEPDLISFLYRVPPELLLQDGLEKGLVRQSVARRFQDLGFGRQRKVVSTDYHYAVIRSEAPGALRMLGGCRALVELGVVDGAQIDAVMARALASPDRREVHRAWEVLNLEVWVRQFVGKTVRPDTP